MRHFLFIDESGNHGLTQVDPSFPVFLLCGILISERDYITTRDKMNVIKRKFWGDKKVIFHSRDIRRCEKEFKILFDLKIKKEFYDKIDNALCFSRYTIISSAIDKTKFIKKFGKLSNDVYELALSFIVERSMFKLDELKECTDLHIIVEKRGAKEDKKLDEHFQRLRARGTGHVDASRIKALNTSVAFRAKKDNINGLQLADLIAYPCARYVIDKERANPAFDIIKDKIYSKNGKMYGLKVYP